MIYLVSQQHIEASNIFTLISPEQSLEIMKDWKIVQYDSETNSLNWILGTLLSIQFGNKKTNTQIVVDCSTVDISIYKNILESKFVIMHNGMFDIKWLYNYNIIPRHIYDTMIVEQLLYLGYPNSTFVGMSEDMIIEYMSFVDNYVSSSGQYWEDLKATTKTRILEDELPEISNFMKEHSGYSLKSLAYRYLGKTVDKTVRGQIIWRGLDESVIVYAAHDVELLEDIMQEQVKLLKQRNMIKAAKIECDFVPVCAYYEWCGVRLDVPKWKERMLYYKSLQQEAQTKLDIYVCNKYPEYSIIDRQGDIFSGYNLTPRCTINWKSSKQVIPVLQKIGFNVRIIDKKTKNERDSVDKKLLATQKGIDDEFLKYYLQYSDATKVVDTYGQTYINAINPKTDHIHTEFRALGTDTGRLACGSQTINVDLAKLKGLPIHRRSESPELVCAYPQLQNLPHDAETRACFIADDDCDWISIDYDGQESRLMASMANDSAMINEYLNGDADLHSLTARLVYHETLKDASVSEIKTKYKHLRQKVKNYEFCFNYAGNDSTLVNQYGFDPQEAKKIYDSYMSGFSGLRDFQNQQRKFVVDNGYILISKATGHRSYWWDWCYWKKVQQSYTREFWEEYKLYHKGTDDLIAHKVSKHFKAKTKYEKNACNSPLQGSGAACFKVFNKELFDWIVDNNYFGVIRFCVPAHDEINLTSPKQITPIVVKKTKECMENAGKIFCTKIPMTATESVGKFWIH